MAAAFQAQAKLLGEFVKMCKANPDILHAPELAFYRDYLQSLGATIPPKVEKKEDTPPPKPATPTPPPMEEDPEPESDLELDEEGVITGETDAELSCGDPSKEVTEDAMDAANEKRSAAMAAASEGKSEEAVALFTEAIELNPASALLHAKRAALLVKLEKPLGAIRDCDKAIALNPDSATAYKFRGRAYRLLGEWERAFKDLTTACKLDYDDVANEWLKEVEPNAKKIQEHKRKQERKKEEKVARDREERVRKAKEEYQKAKTCPMPSAEDGDEEEEGMGGMPGGLGGLFNDPELMSAFQDPDVAAAFADISANPANMAKWQSNPKVAKVMEKMAAKMGGMGGMPGGMGGMPGGMGGMGGMFGGGAPAGPPSGGAAPTASTDDVD